MDEVLTSRRRLLLVGEGNFSFSLGLKERLSASVEMVTTCYEEDSAMTERTLANVEALNLSGARVLTSVDASQLHVHPLLSLDGCFDCVIFQFPHVGGKGNIRKNRDLLKRFFISASKMIAEDGAVVVTLCNGQGGTPADAPQREWCNSWQIVAMATYGGLILSETVPFRPDGYELYKSTGYRSQDKTFNTSGAITHAFHRSGTLPACPVERLAQLQRISDLQHSMFERVSARLLGLLQNEFGYPQQANRDTSSVIGQASSSYPPALVEGEERTSHMRPCASPTIENLTHFLENGYHQTEQDTVCPDSLSSYLHSRPDSRPVYCCFGSCVASVSDSDTPTSCVELIRRHCPISPSWHPIMHYAIMFFPSAVGHRTDDTSEGDTSGNSEPLFDSLQHLRARISCTLLREIPPVAQEKQEPIPFSCDDGTRPCAHCGAEGINSWYTEHFKVPIGIGLTHAGKSTVVAVCLEQLVLNKLGLDDIRLLWSSDVRWCMRLSRQEVPTIPYSMYPPCYVHDLSFWESGGKTFDEESFYALIRGTGGSDLKEVKLIDTFELNGRVSRCYRMVYQSCDRALTKEGAGVLQGTIREVVTAELDLTPR